MANIAYKYRLYPTNMQEYISTCTFGCVRFVYNHCLDKQEEAHKAGDKYISRNNMNNYCNSVLKEEYPFLRDVDKFALTNAIFHLDDGYKRMFNKQTKHPKYKSKRKSKCSYTTNFTNNNIEVGDDYVKLPKLGKVKATIHRKAPGGYKIKSATVSKEHDGSYYVSVIYEYDENITYVNHPESNAIALDYKSDSLYVASDGTVCGSPKYFRKSQRKLAKVQKDLSKKKGSRKGETESNNHKKQKAKVAKIHRHVANQRKDFLHKKSTEIANRYDFVAVETLDMKAMSNKGFRNGKATMDNGYGMFLNMLEYKLRNKGKVFVKVDKWYPSSQICSKCGHQNPEVKDLSIRQWECPVCGTLHDRDKNAATNILNEGLRIYLKDAA